MPSNVSVPAVRLRQTKGSSTGVKQGVPTRKGSAVHNTANMCAEYHPRTIPNT